MAQDITPKQLCLFKRGEGCLDCASRCPVKAVSKAGIDRQRCWDRLNFNRQHLEALTDMEDSTHVCGKCAVDLPCSILTEGSRIQEFKDSSV